MKLRELQSYLKSAGLDSAIFFDGPSIRFFAEVSVDCGCLVVPSYGAPRLIVPGFEADRVRKIAQVKTIRPKESMCSEILKYSGKKKGVLPSAISLSQLKMLGNSYESVSDVCTQLRVMKSSSEMRRITKACALTDVLFEEFLGRLSFVRTEREAAGVLRWMMWECGVEPSFPPIVASGENARIPHHEPTNAKLHGFTIIDFGVVYENYCSDMTRTVFIGTPSMSQRAVYEKVLHVQEQCIDKVRPGERFEKIDEFAKAQIGKSLIHRVGHSVGVEVHDPSPVPWVLRAGGVVTIEPGSYQSKFGIRIEDDVLVTKNEPLVLTQSPKSLVCVSR